MGNCDERAWPLGGYAPGGYSNKCGQCGKEFIGDKRAVECLECAIKATRDHIATLEQAVARLKDEITRKNQVLLHWCPDWVRADAAESRLADAVGENERLHNLLEDVVNELDLSAEAIEEHGPLGTAPAKLVRLVLDQKDLEIRMLQAGFVKIENARLTERVGAQNKALRWAKNMLECLDGSIDTRIIDKALGADVGAVTKVEPKTCLHCQYWRNYGPKSGCIHPDTEGWSQQKLDEQIKLGHEGVCAAWYSRSKFAREALASDVGKEKGE